MSSHKHLAWQAHKGSNNVQPCCCYKKYSWSMRPSAAADALKWSIEPSSPPLWAKPDIMQQPNGTAGNRPRDRPAPPLIAPQPDRFPPQRPLDQQNGRSPPTAVTQPSGSTPPRLTRQKSRCGVVCYSTVQNLGTGGELRTRSHAPSPLPPSLHDMNQSCEVCPASPLSKIVMPLHASQGPSVVASSVAPSMPVVVLCIQLMPTPFSGGSDNSACGGADTQRHTY